LALVVQSARAISLEGEMFLYYVFSYSMSEYERLNVWPQLIYKHVLSYHEDSREAYWCLNTLINVSEFDPDECWSIGEIPLCHNEHNLV
jgi:hypothetical protein